MCFLSNTFLDYGDEILELCEQNIKGNTHLKEDLSDIICVKELDWNNLQHHKGMKEAKYVYFVMYVTFI